MKAKTRKLLALLCIIAMLATLVPTAAFAAEITTGNATVTAPVGGQTPSFEAVSAEPDKYSVEFLKWIDVEANMDIYPTDVTNPTHPYYNFKFEGAKKYKAVVRFTAVGDNTLSYAKTFTINGKETEWTGDSSKRTCTFIAESSATIPTIANREVPVGTAVYIPWPEGAELFQLYEVGNETVIKSATPASSPEGMYTPAYAIATSKTYYFQVSFADGWKKSNEFTVTWTNSAHTITVTGGTANPSSATMGTEITLTPSAAPSGLVFDKWEVVSGDVTVTDNKFTMPDTNVEIKATYKVSIANQEVPVGTDVYIPWPEGATLFKLFEGEIEVLSGSREGYSTGMYIPKQDTAVTKTYKFKVLITDIGWIDSNEFTVEWTNAAHTVTVTGGTASPSSATMGTEITLTPSAAPSGLVFDKWEVVSGGVTVTDNKFTMPDTNVVIKATYKVSVENQEVPVGTDVFIPWPEGATSYQRFEGSTFAGSGDKSGYPAGMYIPAQSEAVTKTYKFSVQFSDGWIDSNEFTVTWKNVTTYAATVSDVTCTSKEEGYTIVDSDYITIKNTGTGALKIDANCVTLTGEGADKFELTCGTLPESGELAGGATTTAWRVKPVTGLAPGTYTATIQFKDLEGRVTETATVSFAVTAKAGEEKTYAATVSDVTCTSKEEGYTTVDSDYITIKNTGTGALKIDANCVTLTGEGADKFELTCGTLPESGELAGGSTTTAWRVKPVTGLDSGTYTATIQFKDLEGRVTETATVSFTVTAKAGTIPTIANRDVPVGTDVFIPWPEGAISYQLLEGSTVVSSGDTSGYPAGMHIPAQSTAVTKTYKFKVQFSGGWIDSNEFTVTWKDAAPTEYDITVTSGKATVGGVEATKAEAGATVTLTAAAAPTGTVFDDWEVVSGDITLADAKSATTTFTMPAGAVSVKATYKTAPAVYSATVADIDITLPAGYGSSAIDALGEQRAIKITNTGTETLNIGTPTLSGTNTDAFEIKSYGGSVVTAGSTNSTAYAVQPKTGLEPGTYTATISCTDTDAKLSAPVTATVTLTVSDHHFDTSTWNHDATYHWNPCTDDGCTAHGNEALHNSDTVKNALAATFDTDGYTGDKYCSICDRQMETGKAIAAGKYIRESKATMTPASITADQCANDLAFASLDSSKYTVDLHSVYDLTDNSLNTNDGQYPNDQKFVDGHQYRIVFSFSAVSPYEYNEMKDTHWSTFTLNDAATDMAPFVSVAGSTYRMIELTAGASGITTYTVSFDANGGTGTMANVTGVSGEYTLPACTFTAPANKQFKGWATSTDGTVISGKTITVTADTTLYAIWEDIPVTEYTITVTAGKATVGGVEATKAEAGKTVTLTANAAPSGKVFDKWVVESGSITLADATSETTTFTMPAGAVIVKATYKAAPHTHTFDQEIIKGEALKTAADCTHDAVYYKSCSCGAISTDDADTFTATGSALDHDYTKKVETEAYLKTAASKCTEYNVYWYACSRCDANAKDDAAATDKYYTSTTAGNHSYDESTWGYRGADGHAHKCLYCEAHDAVQAHIPDREAATETDPIKCTECDYIITAALGHTHSLTKVEAKAPTCTEDGNIEYYTCSGCSKLFADATASVEITDKTSVIIPASHNYATTWSSNADKHWHECTRCHDKKDEAKHSFEWVIDKEATATEKGSKHEECKDCGYKKAAVEIPATGMISQVVEETLDRVPATLTDTYPTTGELKEAMTQILVTEGGSGYSTVDVKLMDVKLQYSTDNGATWIDATEENFPAEGITVVLPYPEGTGKNTHNFVVTHMFTVTSEKLGTVAGQTEQPTVIKTDAGIQVTLKGLSPVSVAWKKVSSSSSSGSSSGGGFSGVYNYPIAISDVENGKATADKTNAVAGDKVTITVTPDAGKVVDEVIVTDKDGKVIDVTKAGDSKYTFTMPAGKVNVAVTTRAADYDLRVVMQINNRNILVNNRTITNDVAPVIVDNRTMVPIRVITETLGGTAHWNADTRTVTLNIDGKTLTMTIGQTISGFDAAPIILNDRTYVPVRYVAERLGASVEWIGTTQQIIITK